MNQRNDTKMKIKNVEDKIYKINKQLYYIENDKEDLHENHNHSQSFINNCQYCGARFMNIESFECHMKCHQRNTSVHCLMSCLMINIICRYITNINIAMAYFGVFWVDR